MKTPLKMLAITSLVVLIFISPGKLNSQGVTCGPNQTSHTVTCKDTNDYNEVKTVVYWVEARVCGISKCEWKWIQPTSNEGTCSFCTDNEQQ